MARTDKQSTFAPLLEMAALEANSAREPKNEQSY